MDRDVIEVRDFVWGRRRVIIFVGREWLNELGEVVVGVLKELMKGGVRRILGSEGMWMVGWWRWVREKVGRGREGSMDVWEMNGRSGFGLVVWGGGCEDRKWEGR